MSDKKSLLAGMAIGAGVALAIREGVGLIFGRRGGWHLDNWHGGMHDHPERFRTTHSVLEPEDSRTESYVPNALHEDDSWLEPQLRAGGRRRFGVFRSTGLDQQRIARNAQRAANESEPYERVAKAASNSGSRTTTSTEAELRKTGTEDNPVRYTRPTDAQGSSGGVAPVIRDEE